MILFKETQVNLGGGGMIVILIMMFVTQLCMFAEAVHKKGWILLNVNYTSVNLTKEHKLRFSVNKVLLF